MTLEFRVLHRRLGRHHLKVGIVILVEVPDLERAVALLRFTELCVRPSNWLAYLVAPASVRMAHVSLVKSCRVVGRCWRSITFHVVRRVSLL